jgi:hypothetical protein
MSSEFQTDVDGAVIRRLRQPPRFSVEQKKVTVNSLQVVMDVGQGVATGLGVDPQLMLQSSRNGGKTWGNERWKSAGMGGDFNIEVKWTQCGQAVNRADRFVATDPVPWRLVDCLISYTVGAH